MRRTEWLGGHKGRAAPATRFLSPLVALCAIASCTSGGSGVGIPIERDAPPAAPTRTNMALPGIGLEAEEGKVFLGVYDAESKTVNVQQPIVGYSLFESEPVPETRVAGLGVTVDLGSDIRTLELITGPYAATMERQAWALGLMSDFYKSIKAAAAARGEATIDSVAVRDEEPISFKAYDCARLQDVVDVFQTTTGVELEDSARNQWAEHGGEFHVCLVKRAKDFNPQANYGVKLSAFVDGAIARDFQGRPGERYEKADGRTYIGGTGCGLTEEVQAGLVEATQMSVAPPDDTAFCMPAGTYTGAACGGAYVQPSFPCFPSCLMGQLCYGLATNAIWYDGEVRTATDVLCDPLSGECLSAAIPNHANTFAQLYATTASAATVDGWTEEEQTAVRSLLIFNRCAAWINSLTTDRVPTGCVREFWTKQAMGVLPKARFNEYRPHLPTGFDRYGGGTQHPPFTTLAAYRQQSCNNTLVLGSTARRRCEDYTESLGLDAHLGGKTIQLFRIADDLALVAESRFASLYVAGGYRGVLQTDGRISYSAEKLRDTINFVRTLNGFEAE